MDGLFSRGDWFRKYIGENGKEKNVFPGND
jgi:hypothetical protein